MRRRIALRFAISYLFFRPSDGLWKICPMSLAGCPGGILLHEEVLFEFDQMVIKSFLFFRARFVAGVELGFNVSGIG